MKCPLMIGSFLKPALIENGTQLALVLIAYIPQPNTLTQKVSLDLYQIIVFGLSSLYFI